MRALLALLLVAQVWAAPAPGQKAPDFVLADLHGNRVSLSQYRGRVVLVNFWACWCDTWKEEVRRLKRLTADRPELDPVILFVSVDTRGRSAVEPLLAREGVFFPVLMDSSASVGKAWGVTTVPTLFVVDPEGVVRYVHQGYPGNPLLAQELAACAGGARPRLTSAVLKDYLLPAESELLRRLNGERARRGLKALELDLTMTEVGREYVQRMLETNNRGHYGPEPPDVRLRARGLTFVKLGENLGQAASPQAVLEAWLDSPDHKSNLLHPGYRQVGVAALRAGGGYLFCLLFGSQGLRKTTESTENTETRAGWAASTYPAQLGVGVARIPPCTPCAPWLFSPLQ